MFMFVGQLRAFEASGHVMHGCVKHRFNDEATLMDLMGGF
jgi:hypothetical protein